MSILGFLNVVGISLFFLCLCRASVIDIKIRYVPNNIIFEAYTIAVLYTILNTIIQKDTSILLGGAISFGIMFVIYVLMLLTEFFRYKKELKRLQIIKKEDEFDVFKDKNLGKSLYTPPSKKKIINVFSILICVFGVYTAVTQPYIPWWLYLTVYLIPFVIGYLLITKKHKKICETFVCSAAISMLGCFGCSFIDKPKNIFSGIVFLAVAVGIEIALSKAFERFYEVCDDIKVDKDGYLVEPEDNPDIPDEPEVYFGGGDVILFGAVALMCGFGNVLSVFLNAGLLFIIVNIILSILKMKKFNAPAAFIPFMAIGYIAYFIGFQTFDITALLSDFANRL
ncbi:MAG: hypothetical protein J5992_09690 [Oscillospiraceae bacterium]|nr:hypothetical protein [Oscillospiraceae bacterium]